MTIGLHPIIAIANAVRSGRIRCTSRPTTAIVPRLAAAASSWKLVTTSLGFFTTLVIRADIQVNNGPYTDVVLRHPGHVSGNRLFRGKSLGVAPYGFAR